ncbi:CoaE-domain-containing protein [Lenzites betulinus]|nr:CoaE-domain-containing protein [Lenzites betulinus]
MLVVGLTGGIATGKSTVSALLRAHNLPIIDADVLARKVVEPGTPALAAIVRAFGPQVLRADGTLDRAALGALVFAPASPDGAADAEAARRRLNAIVHPAVRREMAWAVLRCWWRGERVCVLDVPLLVEGGLWKWVGKVVVVYCSAELQLQRLMKRDGSTREDASGRLNAQLPIAEKVQYADVVLDNSGSLQDLERQVDQLVQRLEKEAGWSWRLSWLCPPLGVASAIWTIGWRALRRSQKAGARKKSGKQQQ